jgi:hypothetical protein
MKQFIFSKNGLLLVFMSMLLSFFACKQDQFIDTPSTDENTAMKQAARQYYDNALVELRKSNIESAKTDALFTALDFTPDWTMALSYKWNGKTYLEVPVKFAGNSDLITSAFSNSTKFDGTTDIRVPVRLIMRQSGNNTFDAHVMLIKSTFPYANGVVPDFNLSKKIDNFTGLEYLYNLDGSFNKGWRHEKGKINATFILGKYDLRQQQQAQTRDCIHYFLTYGGEPIQYLGSSCTPNIFDGSGNNDIPWGSSGGGGDYVDPNNNNNVDDTALDSVKVVYLNPCNTQIWNRLASTTSLGDINRFIRTFNTSTSHNISVNQEPLEGDFNTDATTMYNPTTNTLVITLNTNVIDHASQEYIAVTIMHEVLHAYLSAYLGINRSNDVQHPLMVENYCVDFMADALMSLFPTMIRGDAIALAWGGLDNTPSYKKIKIEDRFKIQTINDKYKSHANGTVCP